MALTRDREHRIAREPRLANLDGSPVESISDNPIAQIDKALAEVGDVAVAKQKADHAARLAARVKQSIDVCKAEHFPELVEALRPEAEAAKAAVDARRAEGFAVLERFIGAYHRSVGLTAPIRRIDGRHVLGINEAASLRKAIEIGEVPERPRPPPCQRALACRSGARTTPATPESGA